MRWAILLLFTVSATPQDAGEMPRGLVRGDLKRVEGTAAQGKITATSATAGDASCGYDARTYIEFNHARVTAPELQPGDPLVILADYRAGQRTCYIRTIHVVPPPPPARKTQSLQRRRESLRPLSTVTVAGLITYLDDSRLILRTREREETLLLRSYTEYLGQGDLAVNRRVQIRAGRSATGALEAHEIAWAELLDPR